MLPLSNSTEHLNAEPESLINTPDTTTAEINNSDVCLSGVDELLNTEVEHLIMKVMKLMSLKLRDNLLLLWYELQHWIMA